MSITCKQIIDAAYSRSTFNDPGKVATEKELIGVIDRYMRRLYADVAEVSPDYFGAQQAVVGSGGVWAKPSTAEVINRIQTAAGAIVSIVPFRDREGEISPRVYRFGASYYTVGLTGDPGATDTLTFFFSKSHPPLNMNVSPSDASNTLDPSFPVQFFDLPVIRVGRYLAVKDNRAEEVQMMMAEEAELMEIFHKHLRNQDAGMVSRFRQRPRLVDTKAEPFGRGG
jgi:hypothetical protein